jgi:hypothetical protein
VGAFIILPVVFTRPKAVRYGIAKAASVRLAGLNSQLIQGVEQVGPCEVPIEIMSCGLAVHGMVQNVWRRLLVERHETSTVILDGMLDSCHQRTTK